MQYVLYIHTGVIVSHALFAKQNPFVIQPQNQHVTNKTFGFFFACEYLNNLINQDIKMLIR